MENVIVQTAFLGDVLLTIPLIQKLKSIDPTNSVTLICRSGLEGSLKDLGVADKVIGWDKSDSSQIKRISKDVGAAGINYLIVPHRSFRTGLLVARLKAKKKIGFKTWWNQLFFDHRVQYDQRFPDALRQLSLVEPIQDKYLPELEVINPLIRTDHLFKPWIERNNLSMRVDPKNIRDVQSLPMQSPDWQKYLGILKMPQKRIAISPGSVWNTKKWTEDGFAKLCSKLLEHNFSVVLLGSPGERIICERIEKQVSGDKSRLVNLAGLTSVSSMVSVLKTCAMAVTNDNGAMHLASVSDIPVVAIFGPTVLSIGYRPWNDKSAIVQNDLNCRPCGKHGSHQCPIGTHACMKEISEIQVLKAMQALSPSLFT